MSVLEIAGLVLAAGLGGAVNAVAGGGTLVTFPTLLFFGTPAIVANATSTLALVVGTSGSIYGYRRHLGPVTIWLRRFLPVSVVGGLVGSVLLTRTSAETFSRLVPFLILFATVLFLAQGAVRKWLNQGAAGAKDIANPGRVFLTLVFQFWVAVYGGYFGAGIGILMLACWGFIGLTDIHQMNTLKTILGSLINLVAAITFLMAGLVHWPKAAVMTVGAVGGYFLGAHFAQKISQKAVRAIITGIGFLLSGFTFYQEFLRN